MRYELRIEAMHCANCASSIERYLRHQPGVDDVGVSFETGEGWLEVDDRADLDELLGAVGDMGYEVSVVNAE